MAEMLARMRTVLLILAVLLMALPGTAAAQSAEEQFVEAQALFDNGDFAAALPLFEGAFAVSGSPNARLMVARSLAKLGKTVQAYDEMAATVADARERAKTEPRYAETRDAAAAELALLENKVAKLIIAVPDSTVSLRVKLDDTDLTDSRIGVPITVEPGDRKIVALSEGKADFEREVSLSAGETKTVTIVFDDAAPVDPEEEPDTGGGVELGEIRMAGIGVAALGVVGLVAFAVTGSMARARHKQLEDECGAVRCVDPSYADVVDEGKKLQLGANVSAGLGGAFLVAGVLMLILGGPDDDGDAARALPAIEVVPGGAALQVVGRF
jgi:hypothetical protein